MHVLSTFCSKTSVHSGLILPIKKEAVLQKTVFFSLRRIKKMLKILRGSFFQKHDLFRPIQTI